MRIAFYAPFKPPDHPVPSGDRQMSRLLIAALRRAGHDVEVVSRLRAILTEPSLVALEVQASSERTRLEAQWKDAGRPDMWFCYHPYYKAPDLIGPDLARRFAIPYVTAEASYAGKRDAQGWASVQEKVIDAVKLAAVNLCFTLRDKQGLERAAPQASFVHIKPFIDPALFIGDVEHGRALPPRLVTVAMMRRGDKLTSFTMLASALKLIADIPWRLTIVGDGPARNEVHRLFDGIDPQRIDWAGEVAPDDVGRFLHEADIYVWPGCGEAYGLAYLEAQAAGLPVIAQNTAGVPEVVMDGETGLLTPGGDLEAYAGAMRRLTGNAAERRRMAAAARDFVLGERSLATASRTIDAILTQMVPR